MIVLDSQVKCVFGDEQDYVLGIGRDFEISTPNGELSTVCSIPYEGLAPQGLDRLAGLLCRRVSSAFARLDGVIEVTFDGPPTTLKVRPMAQYEAWTFASPDGVLVCNPGGGLG